MLSLFFSLLSVYAREAVYQNYNIGGELVNSSQAADPSNFKDTSIGAWASMMFGAPGSMDYSNPLISGHVKPSNTSSGLASEKKDSKKKKSEKDMSDSGSDENSESTDKKNKNKKNKAKADADKKDSNTSDSEE